MTLLYSINGQMLCLVDHTSVTICFKSNSFIRKLLDLGEAEAPKIHVTDSISGKVSTRNMRGLKEVGFLTN
jgi:uncharacterized protein (DUF362 family)